VVKGGCVVESGRHEELLAKEGGAYAALAGMQLSAAAIEAARTHVATPETARQREVASKLAAEAGDIASSAASLAPQPSLESQVFSNSTF
jgi:hypothetical protein